MSLGKVRQELFSKPVTAQYLGRIWQSVWAESDPKVSLGTGTGGDLEVCSHLKRRPK